MENRSSAKWEISPQSSIFDLKLKASWEYRDLLWLLVRRDFVSFYKQTILGPFWFFIQPALTTITFTFVFGNLAGIPTDGLPKPLFYLAGITIWNYFADCLTKTSTVFKDNASIFSKVYFPRLIMPLSIVVSNLIKFCVQLLLFVVLLIYYQLNDVQVNINAYVLLFPITLILMALMGLGLGMIISALTTKYRDLSFLVSFGVQLLMYTTTVIYPLSVAQERYPKYSWIVEFNPLTPILEAFRYGFLGEGRIHPTSLFYATSSVFIVFLTGIVIFNKVEKNFVDTV